MRALLAIETSTPVARVGLYDIDTGARLAAASATSERHSSNLLRLCVEVAQQAGVAVAALSGIACGAGPGSFTGLRVGYAVAKGFATPFDIPFLSVSSLQALAWDMAPLSREGERLLPCLDAGKGQVYVASFARGNPGVPGEVARTSEDWVVTPNDVASAFSSSPVPPGDTPTVFGGSGGVRYRALIEGALAGRGRFVEVPGPSADAVAAYAIERFKRGDFEDLGRSVPAYGRAPDITRPKRSGP
jgi:tRNA threonylcarbamoyladenosine biosynthesis protein TsaB